MKNSLISWLAVSIVIIASALTYSGMPEQLPIHWNINNEVDKYAHKAFALFFLPGLMLLLILLFRVMPYIDSRKQNYKKFEGSIHIIQNIVILALLVLHGITIAYGYGAELNISTIVPPVIGIIFVAIGNYMPRFQPNSYFGIKTYHTLNNETVWRKTHKAVAKFYVVGGFLMMLTAFVQAPYQVFAFLTIVVIVVLSSLYLSAYYAKQA